MYTIYWSKLSEITFAEEIGFILEKWNQDEVDKFNDLILDFLEILVQKPEIGLLHKDFNIYSFVVSKQTTLFYRINKSESKLELVLFWNNKQNPNILDKLLKNF
jgi:plasmid stabilization system protein ParE